MANNPFKAFLGNYGIRLLSTPNDNYQPGLVLEKKRKAFTSFGHLENVLDLPKRSWETQLRESNLINETVNRTLSLKASASLKEFGVEISGGLQKVTSVDFSIEQVTARDFVNMDNFTLMPKILELKKKDKAKWKLLRGKWYAYHLFYASHVVFTFQTDAAIDVKALIKNKISIQPEASIRWSSNKRFVISKNNRVPFGFTGWKI